MFFKNLLYENLIFIKYVLKFSNCYDPNLINFNYYFEIMKVY
jgi:hypothetical protein